MENGGISPYIFNFGAGGGQLRHRSKTIGTS